jgi:hypothetical protein
MMFVVDGTMTSPQTATSTSTISPGVSQSEGRLELSTFSILLKQNIKRRRSLWVLVQNSGKV